MFWTNAITVLLVIRLTLLFIPVSKAQWKIASVAAIDELPYDYHLDKNLQAHQRGHQHNTQRYFVLNSSAFNF